MLTRWLRKAWPVVSARTVYEHLLDETHGVGFDPEEALFGEFPEYNIE